MELNEVSYISRQAHNTDYFSEGTAYQFLPKMLVEIEPCPPITTLTATVNTDNTVTLN